MTTRDIATLGLRVDAREVRDGDQALDQFGQTAGQVEQKTDRTNAAMARMTKMAKAVASALAVMEIYERVKEVTLLAARYNELGVVMTVLGRNAGISGAQLAATESALRKTGISATQSRDAIGKLISANIDLSKATALARLAQDAAVIGGMNSSEAFASLVKGIQSAEKETLQTLGLNVNFQQSYEKLAKSIGKKTDALTESEKTQAAVNAALEKAPTIAGAYEASLTNAGKQMRSMSRYVEDLKVQLGQPFQNPFGELIGGATKALKLLSENVGTIRAVMEATISAVAPAVKVAMAYFALFVAAPAVYAAAVAALTPLVHALAVYAMNVAIGQANTIGLNTALFGTSVAARLADGSLSKLMLVANLLFAAFAGWQIGEYLDGQFVQVRVAGEIMAGGLLEAWERIKFGGTVAFDAITLVARNTVTTVMKLFANIWEAGAKGMRMIGDDAHADKVEALAGRFRKAAEAQGTFAGRTAAARAEMEKNIKVIDQDTDRRVTAALVADKLSEATRGTAVAAKTAAAEKKELTDAEKKAYAAKVKQATDYIQSLKDEQLAIGANASQLRMLAAAKAATAAPTAALRMQIMQEALSLDIATQAWEKNEAARKLADDAATAFTGDTSEIWKQVEAINAQIEAYGKSSKAAIAAEIEKHEGILAARLLGEDVSDKDRIAMEDRIRALRTLAERQAALKDMKVNTEGPQKLLDVMEALSDASKDAATNMASAFGKVGESLGGLMTSMTTYERTQAAIAKQLKSSLDKATEDDDPKAAAKAKAEAARAGAQAQMKSYGDMAKAAKGFFKENTAGYRAMEGAEKAFRAFEIALAFKTMLEKSGILQAFTALFVTGKATETAATVASVAPDVAASAVKGQAAAAAGVAGQAQGDPYSAWARMAAMAAVMAGLGFAVGGIGGKTDTTAVDRQKATGTGSILGDKSAKSDSIKRAIEITAANSDREINYAAGMLRALLSIESALGGLGSLLAQNGVDGSTPGKSYSSLQTSLDSTAGRLMLGPFVGKILGAIFGGKTETIDGGVMASRTTVAGAAAGGLQATKYTDTKTDGGWFRSDKYRTSTESLGAETNAQFAMIISNMADSITEAGKLLGLGGDAFTQRLNAFVVDIGKISTKGLKPEEIQAQLEAAFSKVGDDMARWSVGGIAQFQKVGEGALETLVRIASNYATLDSILASAGMTAAATGLASVAMREQFIDAAGGIDALSGKASSFADNFLTEAERLAPVQKYVADQLAAMGLSALNTRDKFKSYLLALDPMDAAEQRQIVALLDLQEAFAKTHAATVDLTKSQQEIADERADLQDQLDELMMTTTQLTQKQRNALDLSNRALFDQVKAAEAQKAANDALRESMTASVDTFKGNARSLREFAAGLQTGNLSTLTPVEQEAEAKAQYAAIAEAALGGDKDAFAKFNEAAQKYLTLSQQVNGGNSTYSAAYAGVLAMAEKLAKYSDSRVDAAQAQIDALDRAAAASNSLVDATWALADELRRQREQSGAPSLTNPNGIAVLRDTGGMQTASELAMLRAQLKAEAEAAAKLQTDAAVLNRDVTMRAADKVAEAVTSSAPRRSPREDSYATLDG